MESASVALFPDRTNCAGEGKGCGSVRDGVRALIEAGPPATLRVGATFDWGEQEKYFDAREGDQEDSHVREILEYFTVQHVRKS